MKVDLQIPQTNDLIGAYNALQSDPSLPIPKLVLYSMWTRFDPRLGEILIQYISKHWRNLNPMEVEKSLACCAMPYCWGVLCEHVLLILPKTEHKTFKNWRNCCLSESKKTAENYFLGLFSFAGKKQKSEAYNTLPLYRKWGYLSSELMLPLHKTGAPARNRTYIPKEERIKKLKKILSDRKSISVNDYLALFEGKVSKRVAELDLNTYARRSGNTRAATYFKK